MRVIFSLAVINYKKPSLGVIVNVISDGFVNHWFYLFLNPYSKRL